MPFVVLAPGEQRPGLCQYTSSMVTGKSNCHLKITIFNYPWWLNELDNLDMSQMDTEQACDMMTSSYGNIFRVTGPLCGEFTGPQ